jgi:hypothetical protein
MGEPRCPRCFQNIIFFLQSSLLWRANISTSQHLTMVSMNSSNFHLQGPIATYFALISCLSYLSTLKMEEACVTETSVCSQRTIRAYRLKQAKSPASYRVVTLQIKLCNPHCCPGPIIGDRNLFITDLMISRR